MRQWADANPDKLAASARARYRTNPEKYRAKGRRQRYGITPEEYRDHVVGQAGRCLICLRVPDHDLHVDHDHATGAIRGLLCNKCNRGIGLLNDDPQRLVAAFRYLGGAA